MERARLPPVVAAVCAPSEAGPGGDSLPHHEGCLLAAPAPTGLLLWPADGEAEGPGAANLTLEGKAWQLLAGAAFPCGDRGHTERPQPHKSDFINLIY